MPYIGYLRTLNAMNIIDEVTGKMADQQNHPAEKAKRGPVKKQSHVFSQALFVVVLIYCTLKTVISRPRKLPTGNYGTKKYVLVGRPLHS